MPVTLAQLRALRLAKKACARAKVGPMTLKHRGLAGTQTAVGNNKVLKARSGSKTLEATTDSLVYVVWEPVKVRGGTTEGGDGPAGRTWIGRLFAQMTALDTSANPITLSDDDWVLAPDGTIFKVENPTISPDGGFYTFVAVTQR